MSRAEALRRRVDSQFVGRRAQLALFADNLRKDPHPDAGPDAADFLFHVRGVGGIGKSTLIAQWQETARRAGARTALIDDTDVQGIDTALAALAAQLAPDTAPFKDFDKALEQYRRAQSTPPDHADLPSLPARMVAQAALGAANTFVPGTAAFTTPEALAQGTDRLITAVRRRRPTGDSELATLSRAFVTELGRLCEHEPAPWAVLFLDTWEITGRHLDGWLRELIAGAYGDLPLEVIVVLAGRDELAERDWARLRPAIVDVALEAFTEQEARELLASRGVVSGDAVDAIVRMSLGLPLLLALLAGTDPHSAEDVADAGTDMVDKAVQRFLQWIPEPSLRETVLAAALPPRLDRDLFCRAVDDPTAPGWDWLLGQPFVTGHGDGHQYHAVVRASLLQHHRIRDPHAWRTGHSRLAEHHAAAREALRGDLSPARLHGNTDWLRHLLDETYHLLCAVPSAHLATALERLAESVGLVPDSLATWAEVFTLAARDTADPTVTHWSDRLHSAVATADPAGTLLTALAAPGLPLHVRAQALTSLACQLVWLNREPDALPMLDQALRLSPNLPMALIQRGHTHTALGHYDRAVIDFDAALAIDPTAADALARRGLVHTLTDRLDQAIADCDAAHALDPADTVPLVFRGVAHRQAARIDEAIADFSAVLTLDPDDSMCLSLRGGLLLEIGRMDEALADLDAAVSISPGNGPVLHGRGKVHLAAGRLDAAVDDFTAALAVAPENDVFLSARAEAHCLAEQFDDAIADLTAALAVNPQSATAFVQRGLVHRQLDRFDPALADLNAALVIDPEHDTALCQRGLTHQMAGELDQALDDYTAALVINPEHDMALTGRGQIHHRLGRLDEALADLGAALTLDPQDAWTLYWRAQVHRDAGRAAEAEADYTAALAIDPEHIWALCERADAHLLAEQYDRAIADYTAVLALDPSQSEALCSRGEAHHSAGRLDEAAADYTAALAIDPEESLALFGRGETHRITGRLDEAIADFTAALALAPDFAGTLAWRGRTYRQAGHLDLALTDLDAAIALAPDDAITRGERAELYRCTDRLDEALADLTAALALDPSDTEIRCALVSALRRQGRHHEAREALAEAALPDPAHAGPLLEAAMLDLDEHGPDHSVAAWDALLAAVRDADQGDRTALAVLHAVAVPGQELEALVAEFLAVPNAIDARDMLRKHLRELTASPVADRATAALDLLG